MTGLVFAVQSLPAGDVLNGTAHILIIAFMTTLLATPIARRIAIRRGVVDVPNEKRKIHKEPTPYLGGLAVFAGITVAIVASWFLPGFETTYRGVPVAVVIGMVAIMLTGLGDDVFGWDPRTKIAGQLVAAAALAIEDVGTRVAEGMLTPIFGGANETLVTMLGETFVYGDVYYWLGTFLIAFLVLGACNAANFIDGLDGLLSGTTGITALAVLVISLMVMSTYPLIPGPDGAGGTTASLVDGAGAGDAARSTADGLDAGGAAEDGLGPGTGDAVRPADRTDLPIARVILSIALLGAVLGFLPWNFNPAVIFLGDCGSLMLGYLCAVLILMLGDRGQTHWVIAGLLVFALPIMDTTLAIVRRRLAGKPMSAADDQHIHHQIKRALGSVKKSVLTLYGVSSLFAGLGVGLVALVLAGGRARVIYAAAIIVFGFVGVLALKAARHRAGAAAR